MTPPMVWRAVWLTGRPVDCCAATTDSTTAAGLLSMTGWISAAVRRAKRSAGVSASTIKGGGPSGSTGGPAPTAGM
eukprot:4603267-Alexandrium_andersonii.AAC.1